MGTSRETVPYLLFPPLAISSSKIEELHHLVVLIEVHLFQHIEGLMMDQAP